MHIALLKEEEVKEKARISSPSREPLSFFETKVPIISSSLPKNHIVSNFRLYQQSFLS